MWLYFQGNGRNRGLGVSKVAKFIGTPIFIRIYKTGS